MKARRLKHAKKNREKKKNHIDGENLPAAKEHKRARATKIERRMMFS
jgi:hypothetical protein